MCACYGVLAIIDIEYNQQYFTNFQYNFIKLKLGKTFANRSNKKYCRLWHHRSSYTYEYYYLCFCY